MKLDKNEFSSLTLFFVLAFLLISFIAQRVENNEVIERVDSLMTISKLERKSFEKQAREFNLILRDVMGDYGDIIPNKIKFIERTVVLNTLSARQTLNSMLRYLFRHKQEVRDALERFYFYEKSIDDTLGSYELLTDLKYIFLAESWAYPMTISGARSGGAVGGWQFMEYTAAELGVEISKDIDMRRDSWYMSKVFCEYITKLREQSSSYSEAVRGYNTGIKRFLEAASKQSWVTKTWYVDVNDENNIYLYWILVWKLIYEDPLSFGIKVDYNLPPVEIKVIKVRLYRNYDLTFYDLSNQLKCDMFILKDLNPGFLKVNKNGERVIPGPRRRKYVDRYLKIPKSSDVSKLSKIKIRGIRFF